MKIIIKGLALCLAIAQWSMSNAQQFKIVGGNVTVNNTSLVLNDMDFVNDGTFSSTDGTVKCVGAATTSISGTSPTTFANLTIAKTSNGVQLENSGTVTGTLSMEGGNLDVQTSDLTIAPGGSIAGASDAQYIQTSGTGTLQQTVGNSAVVFPVGNSAYNPATLTNSGTADVFSVKVADETLDAYPSGNAVTTNAVNRTWDIDEATQGDSDVTMTLQWNADEELSNFTRSASGIARWTGTAFDNPSSLGANGTNGSAFTQTRSGITEFSEFVVKDVIVANLEVTIFLQGPYSSNAMDANLSTLIPMTNPYGLNTIASSIPTNAVDWVKVEIRDSNTSTYNVLDQKACFVNTSGQLMETDGTVGITFDNLEVTSGYLVVTHRNHLGVMTNSLITFE